MDKVLAARQQSETMFRGFAVILLASLFVGIALDMYYLAGIPAFLLLTYLTLVDFRKVFFLLLICLPLSTEFYFPNGLATDLPTEPLMVGLMLVYGLYCLRHGREMGSRFLRHPITLLVLLHLFWIFATSITSENLMVSFKFSLAKLWYIVVFFFMAGSILKRPQDIRLFFWSILLPLIATIMFIWARHAQTGFSFDTVSGVLDPFYRNHVNYAALLALFTPFVWFARQWYPSGSLNRWAVNIGLVILLLAIQFSYTRTAYLTLMIAIGAFFIIRLQLVRLVLVASLVVGGLLIGFMVSNNNYLQFAPDFEKTVTHHDFDNLVEATYKMQDISTMERFYRWIAGGYMSGEKPLVGFGPGNFYNFYKSYTVSSFETYVSDNPEKSGIHSYYLMTLVEQGIPGLLIFLALCFFALIRGEKIYATIQKENKAERGIVMASMLSLIIILAFILINDMIETDKMGSFFFMFLAFLVNSDGWNAKRPQDHAPKAAPPSSIPPPLPTGPTSS